MTGEPMPDVDAAIDSFAQSAFRIRDERDALAAENARLRADAMRLRAALITISHLSNCAPNEIKNCWAQLFAVGEAARALLAGKEEPKP